MKKGTKGNSISKKAEAKKSKLLLMVLAGAAFVIIVAVVVVVGMLSLNNNSIVDKAVVDEKLGQMEKFIDDNKWKEAKDMGNELLAMNIDQKTKVSVYWELGISESYQRNFGTAIDYANKILSISSADGHYLLGLIYTDMEKYDQAIDEFTIVGQTGPMYKSEADKRIEELKKLTAGK
jgi:tetratricopeptide (TPR) repeat protein